MQVKAGDKIVIDAGENAELVLAQISASQITIEGVALPVAGIVPEIEVVEEEEVSEEEEETVPFDIEVEIESFPPEEDED